MKEEFEYKLNTDEKKKPFGLLKGIIVLNMLFLFITLFIAFFVKIDISKDDMAEEIKIRFDTLLESDLDIYYDKVYYLFDSYHLVYKYDDYNVYDNYKKLCEYYSTECYVKKNKSIYNIKDVTVYAEKLFVKDNVKEYNDFKIYKPMKISKPDMLDKRSILKLNEKLITDLDKLSIGYKLNLSYDEFDIIYNVSIYETARFKSIHESVWEVRELLRVYIETIYGKSLSELEESDLYVMPAIFSDLSLAGAQRISTIQIPKEIEERNSLKEI